MKSITQVVQNLLKPYIDRGDANIYAVMGRNGAKNLLPFDLDEIKAANTDGTWSGNVYTRRNVTFTVNSDYSVDVAADGVTNTQASGFFYYSASGTEKFVGKSVTLTGCPVSGGSSTYNLQAYRAASVDGSGGTEKDTGSGVTLDWLNDGTGTKAMVAISVGAEIACNAKFKPMLRYAEDIDSTYQPPCKTNQQLTAENQTLTQYANSQSNPNLLDNPFFTVNQRGASSYSGASIEKQYTFDRWLMSWVHAEVSVTKNADGTITFTNNSAYDNAQLLQFIDNPKDISNKVVTTSIDVTAITGTVGFDFTLSENPWTSYGYLSISSTGLKTKTFTVGDMSSIGTGGLKILLALPIGASITFRAIKLELGSVSTLTHDTAPNYQQELAKCQRYYVNLNPNSISYNMIFDVAVTASSDKHIYATIKTPVPMRTTPTLTLTGGLEAKYGSNLLLADTDYTKYVMNYNLSIVKITFEITNENITVPTQTPMILDMYSGVAELSADL